MKRSRPRKTPPPPKPLARVQPGTWEWSVGTLLGLGLIVLGTLWAYLPALEAGFVWDDDWYVTNNPHLLTLGGLYKIWFEIGATVQYYPLVFTSFWIEHRLWGLSPFGYHLTNVCLHAVNSLLVWVVLRRLAVPGAWLAAALFAVHPIHVESVAWITERKNVLSGAFYLLSLLAYCRAVDLDRRDGGALAWRPYLLALAFFILALLSKTVTCTLPVVILIILWWKGRGLSWRSVFLLLPMFAIGLILGLLTAWLERNHVGAIGEDWNLSPLDRVLIASRAVWFYVGKLAWPSEIIFFYPRWVIDATDWKAYIWPALTAATLAVLWIRRRRLGKGPLAAALFFGTTLGPALGFVDVYPMRFSFVANHFAYLASLGPITLAAGLAASALPTASLAGAVALSRRERIATAALLLAAGVVVVALALLTVWNAGAYTSTEALWRDTIAKNPDAWLAHNNLANDLVKGDRHEEAAGHFREALRAKPDYADGYYNLGNTLLALGQVEEAGRQYRKAIELKPTHVEAHNGLGIVLDKQGRPEEALAQFRLALELRPGYMQAHLNLALLMRKSGNDQEMVEHLRQALFQKPDMADARVDLGLALVRLNRPAEAMPEISEALRLNPASAEAHNALGNALLALGQVEAAAASYGEAIRLQPDYADAHSNLGLALVRRGDLDGAVERLTRALAIRPAFAEAHHALGGALASQGKLEEAIVHMRKAVELAPNNVDAYRNLGLALAMTGQASEAVPAYRSVLQLQPRDTAARCKLAELLNRLGDRQAAIAEYQQVLQVDPANAVAARAIADLSTAEQAAPSR